jgi:hypothetical protein
MGKKVQIIVQFFRYSKEKEYHEKNKAGAAKMTIQLSQGNNFCLFACRQQSVNCEGFFPNLSIRYHEKMDERKVRNETVVSFLQDSKSLFFLAEECCLTQKVYFSFSVSRSCR